jgi:hypothetical protein
MEAEVATLSINRVCSACLQVRSYSLFVEPVDSDCEMIDFARRISGSENQEILSENQLVVAVTFVYLAAEGVLVENQSTAPGY